MQRVIINVTTAEGPYKIPASITVKPIEPLLDEAEGEGDGA